MTRPYLILVAGRLAERRLTLVKALARAKELTAKGYKQVSVAYSTGEES